MLFYYWSHSNKLTTNLYSFLVYAAQEETFSISYAHESLIISLKMLSIEKPDRTYYYCLRTHTYSTSDCHWWYLLILLLFVVHKEW